MSASVAPEAPSHFDHQGGTAAPWYRPRELTEAQREFFRDRAKRSREAKAKALRGGHGEPRHAINAPALAPEDLMPQLAPHGTVALSLFSGGGGLDLGFERAGFTHAASYDTLEASGRTLLLNRPNWNVFAGDAGNVREIDWRPLRGEIDVLHGGPPCQPFSAAGRQRGEADERNLLPEFVRAVREIRPAAFVAENVRALAGPKFAPYLEAEFLGPLRRMGYTVTMIRLSAHDFGVPQVRHRVFFVGLRSKRAAGRFRRPRATHRADHLLRGPAPDPEAVDDPQRTMGVRAALGLPDIGVDALAPTLRSTLTGPRHTTSVLSSASSQKAWASIDVWASGVAATREAAQVFPAENGHFRMSVDDCAVLQGFPASWHFDGAVYMALGQIGNSVVPPVGYRVAKAIADALQRT